METAQVALADPFEHDLAEVQAAISLVAAGAATRVRIACLPGALAVASHGLALAQAAGVGFGVLRDGPDLVTIEVGPRIGSLEPVRG